MLIDRFYGLVQCLHNLIEPFAARIKRRLSVEGRISLSLVIAMRAIIPALFRVPARFWSVCLFGSTPRVKEKSWFAISILLSNELATVELPICTRKTG